MFRTTLESCSTLVTAVRDIVCYCNAGYSSIIPKVFFCFNDQDFTIVWI